MFVVICPWQNLLFSTNDYKLTDSIITVLTEWLLGQLINSPLHTHWWSTLVTFGWLKYNKTLIDVEDQHTIKAFIDMEDPTFNKNIDWFGRPANVGNPLHSASLKIHLLTLNTATINTI
jgi:hypothetical protein